MRLQVAIDRVSVERADEIIELTAGCADIIEIGTSLIKDSISTFLLLTLIFLTALATSTA